MQLVISRFSVLWFQAYAVNGGPAVSLPLVVVLQILLIGAELFALKAFTRFEPTQEWALWLLWYGGLASVAATAASAHLLCTAFVANRQHLWPAQADNAARADDTRSARVSHAHWSNRLVIRLSAFMLGLFMLVYSLFTLVSVSASVYDENMARLRPSMEALATAQSRAAHACADAVAVSPQRSLREIDELLRADNLRPKDEKTLRAERAKLIGVDATREACTAAEGAVRDAKRTLLSELPSQSAMMLRLPLGLNEEWAVWIYPALQGTIVWAFAFAGAAALHMAARRRREQVQHAATDRPSGGLVAASSPVVGLGLWLEQIQLGGGSYTAGAALDGYVSWCRAREIETVSDHDAVKKLIVLRMSALGIERRRSGNSSVWRGVELPK